LLHCSNFRKVVPLAAFDRFDGCGHFAMWDQPKDAARVILEAVG